MHNVRTRYEKCPSNSGAHEVKSHRKPYTFHRCSQGPSQLERALAFAAADIPIFPCNGASKKPYTDHGFKDATTDQAQIKGWWQRHPDASIGIPTGKASGLAVVDIDRKNGKDGFHPYLERGIELPATRVNPTPSGGEHHIYAYPDGIDKIASRNDVLSGVDIKVDGGYVIAHGNLMPDDLKALTPYPLALEDAFKAAKRPNGSTQSSPTSPPRHATLAPRKEDLAREYDRAREWLGYIDMSSRDTWNNVGLALYGTFGDDGFELWDDASKRVPEKYNKTRSQEAQWNDFKRKNPAPGIGLLRSLAVGGGWSTGAQSNGAQHNGGVQQEPDTDIGEPDADASDVPQINGLLQIKVIKGERPRVVSESLDVIRNSEEFYDRGGEIVRVPDDEIIPVAEPYLEDWLGRNVRYLRIVSVKENMAYFDRCDVPNKVARNVLARAGEWELPKLQGIIRAPTIRPDGSILDKPGHDLATGLLLLPGKYPPIPENPTEEHARQAWKTLREPFAEFSFDTIFDRAVFYAALFTALTRHLHPLAPAFLFDAADAGSGKTMLAQCIQRICGVTADTMPETKDQDEIRKRLMSILRSSNPIALFDNLKGELASSVLENFITTQWFSDRVLGTFTKVTLPTKVTVLITANNLRVAGDLVRRVLTARLDAKTENPEGRSFRLHPIEFCEEHRLYLAGAALTLLRAFHVAGRPRDPYMIEPFGSFEAWDAFIRQCIGWLAREGIAVGPGGHVELGDPIRCIRAMKADEPGKLLLGRFLAAARAKYGHDAWTVKNLLAYSEPGTDLRDVIDEIASSGRGGIDAAKFGNWLRANKGMRRSGLYLDRHKYAGDTNAAVRWFVASERDVDNSGGL